MTQPIANGGCSSSRSHSTSTSDGVLFQFACVDPLTQPPHIHPVHSSVQKSPLSFFVPTPLESILQRMAVPQNSSTCHEPHSTSTAQPAVETATAESLTAAFSASDYHRTPSAPVGISAKRKHVESCTTAHASANSEHLTKKAKKQHHSSAASSLPLPPIVHLRGVVVAISPIVQHEERSFYFVELSDAASATDSQSCDSVVLAPASSPLSTFLLFIGSGALRWYPFLHIGSEYLITRLRTSVLFQDQPGHQRMVFVNTDSVSNTPTTAPAPASPCPFDQGDWSKSKQTLIFTRKSLDNGVGRQEGCLASSVALSNSTRNSMGRLPSTVPTLTSTSRSPTAALSLRTNHVASSSHSHRHCSTSPIATCINYIGVISRITSFGVYQLDHDDNCTLYLHPFHLQLNWFMDRLVVGVRIRLHYVHLFMVEQQCRGFLCCLYSNIDIVDSVVRSSPTPPSPNRRSTHLWLRWSMYEVALLLHTAREWKNKFGRLGSTHHLLQMSNQTHKEDGLLIQFLRTASPNLFASPINSRTTSMEMYQQFFQHELCSYYQPPPLIHSSVNLIPIAQLMQLPLVRQLVDSFNPSPSTSTPSTTILPSKTDWSYRTIHSSQLQPSCILVGLLQSTIHPSKPNFNGAPASHADATKSDSSSPLLRTSLQLVDRSGRIDCVVIGDITPIHQNAIIQISHFLVVMESSPHVRSVTSLVDSVTTMLVFDMKDVCILHSMEKDAPSHSHSLLIMHKSDTIHKPSISSTMAQSMKPTNMLMGPPAPPTAASSSSQRHLTSQSFNYLLHTHLEVELFDPRSHVSRPIALTIEPANAEIYSFLKIHRMIEVDGLIAVANGANLPSFRLDSTSIVKSLPFPATIPTPHISSVLEILICPLPSTTIPYRGASVAIDLVSFEGLVLQKEFRQEEKSSSTNPQPRHHGHHWWLNVRDLNSVHTIPVHIDPTLHCFPLIIPGSRVRFHRMSRRVTHQYHIQIEDVEGSHFELLQTVQLLADKPNQAVDMALMMDDGRRLRELLPTYFPLTPLSYSFLSSLSPFAPVIRDCTYRLRVRVSILTKLVLSWYCSNCSQPIQPTQKRCLGVHRACQTRSPRLTIECKLQVDDGSAVANLFIDGNLVWDFLHLSPLHRSQLLAFSLELGRYEFLRLHHRSAVEDETVTSIEGLNADSDSSAVFLQARSQMWSERFRQDYGGMEFLLYAKQFYSKNVVDQAIRRQKSTNNSTTTTSALTRPHSSTMSPATSSANHTSSSSTPINSTIPFASCQTQYLTLASHRFSTLQPPHLSLRAIEIQPIRTQLTQAAAARGLLQQLQQEMNRQ